MKRFGLAHQRQLLLRPHEAGHELRRTGMRFNLGRVCFSAPQHRSRIAPLWNMHTWRNTQMLRLRLLGTGSPAPLPERQGSAVLLSLDQEHLLVDAGRGVTTQLVRAGVAPQELSAIFLTHHHYDHIGNLGDLLLTAWHGGSTSLPLIGPPGTQQIVQALFQQVYHRELVFAAALDRATGVAKPDIQSVVGD
jgi:glyoxylase-like metal-dependent hydrolase (beta-lactamase superfamily II)